MPFKSLQFIDKFAFWLRRATLSQTQFKPVWRLASWGHLSILGQGSIGLGWIIEKDPPQPISAESFAQCGLSICLRCFRSVSGYLIRAMEPYKILILNIFPSHRQRHLSWQSIHQRPMQCRCRLAAGGQPPLLAATSAPRPHFCRSDGESGARLQTVSTQILILRTWLSARTLLV